MAPKKTTKASSSTAENTRSDATWNFSLGFSFRSVGFIAVWPLQAVSLLEPTTAREVDAVLTGGLRKRVGEQASSGDTNAEGGDEVPDLLYLYATTPVET
jgi:hypothetical protein